MLGLTGFDFARANSLEEAWDIVARRPEAQFLAGGSDLLVKLKTGLIRTPMIISLKNIHEIQGIVDHNDWIEIGALTTVGEVVNSEVIKEKYPLLHMSARNLASKQVRNLATIGGNLCNASPAGDLCVALACLEADVKLEGPEGKRRIKLENFFRGPDVTSLKKGEILTSILIPFSKGDWVWNYRKLGNRNGMDIAIVNLAIGLRREQEICKERRIALGAVAPTPIRARRAEKKMVGEKLGPEIIEQVALLASQESSPVSDIRATADYRREMVTNLTRRLLHTI